MDKLWYKRHDNCKYLKQELECSRAYIQKYINLYASDLFSEPEDITADNLEIFVRRFLQYYQLYIFSEFTLSEVASAFIETYLKKAYEGCFPEN